MAPEVKHLPGTAFTSLGMQSLVAGMLVSKCCFEEAIHARRVSRDSMVYSRRNSEAMFMAVLLTHVVLGEDSQLSQLADGSQSSACTALETVIQNLLRKQ